MSYAHNCLAPVYMHLRIECYMYNNYYIEIYDNTYDAYYYVMFTHKCACICAYISILRNETMLL